MQRRNMVPSSELVSLQASQMNFSHQSCVHRLGYDIFCCWVSCLYLATSSVKGSSKGPPTPAQPFENLIYDIWLTLFLVYSAVVASKSWPTTRVTELLLHGSALTTMNDCEYLKVTRCLCMLNRLISQSRRCRKERFRHQPREHCLRRQASYRTQG